MAQKINRRKALAAGAASAGFLAGACTKSQPAVAAKEAQACPLDNVWGEDFLTQWSPPENLERNLEAGDSHIRLSCASYRLRLPKAGESFGDVVEGIRKAGYTACETGSHGWDGVTDSQISEMKAALKENDVQFYGIHAWANILDSDMDAQRAAVRHYIDTVGLAERFGLEFILTHTGGRSSKAKDRPHPENHTKMAWEISVNNTKEVISSTSGSKIALAFEAVNSCNNNTPQSHVRLKEDVGDDRVKVTLDPTNMLHAGTYFRTSELIQTCFDLLGEDICYAHAKDKTWTSMMPSFEAATLGDGGMDFEVYLANLSRMKYPRALLIEHLPQEQYAPSKKHLMDTAAKLGVKIYS
jgi:sugar phosphate isomerase/epimerase